MYQYNSLIISSNISTGIQAIAITSSHVTNLVSPPQVSVGWLWLMRLTVVGAIGAALVATALLGSRYLRDDNSLRQTDTHGWLNDNIGNGLSQCSIDSKVPYHSSIS